MRFRGFRRLAQIEGVIEQIDTPAEVFDAPRTHYVADFMGVTNLFEARVRESSSGRLAFDAFGIASTRTMFLPVAADRLTGDWVRLPSP